MTSRPKEQNITEHEHPSVVYFHQVVAALDIIIEKFQDYIAPHASALTQQLTRCFMEYASVSRAAVEYVYLLLSRVLL